MHPLSAAFLRLHSRACEVAGPLFEVHLFVGEAREFPKKRNRAYCHHDERTGELCVVVSPKLLREDICRIEGVLRHEFGHALLFFFGEETHGERDADAVAEQVFGDNIYYDQDTIQTVRGGARPRPAHLGL